VIIPGKYPDDKSQGPCLVFKKLNVKRLVTLEREAPPSVLNSNSNLNTKQVWVAVSMRSKVVV
jgi:hypothetical protein